MDPLQIAIGKLLKTGVLASFITVLMGGIWYLFQHGMDPIQLQDFPEHISHLKSVNEIVTSAFQLGSLSLIQLGLLILVLIQILRVILIIWMFYKNKEKILLLSSLFILLVLIFSLFFNPT